MSNDGTDVAAAIQTIREIGEHETLDASVADAFPGSNVTVENERGRFALAVHQHGLLRPLAAAELSDGTLRYLLLIAALLTPRPPELMVLNEPETSLHPDELPALARLMVRAARNSQIIGVTHSRLLIESLATQPECHSIGLEKSFGETRVAGLGAFGSPPWNWPSR